MERLQDVASPLAEELPRLVFLEPALSGRRVLVAQCGTGALVQFLVHLGATRVVGVDTRLDLLDQARGSMSRERKVDWRLEEREHVPGDDGAFDVVVDFSLAAALARGESWRIAEYARLLHEGGVLLASVRNPQGAGPLSLITTECAPREVAYVDAVHMLSGVFPHVAVFGQSPLFGFSFMSFNADPHAADVGLDTALMGEKPETVAHYLLVAGAEVPDVQELTLVQLPFTELALKARRGLEEARLDFAGEDARMRRDLLKAKSALEERERVLALVADRLPRLRTEILAQAEAAETGKRFQQELVERLRSLQEDLRQSQEQLHAQEENGASSQQKLTALLAEVARAKLAMQRADDRAGELHQRLRETAHRLLEAERDKGRIAADLEATRNVLARAGHDAERNLQAAEDKLAALQASVDDTERRLNATHQRLLHNEEELSNARQREAQLTVQCAQGHDEIDILKTQLLEAQEEVTRLAVLEREKVSPQELRSALQRNSELEASLQDASLGRDHAQRALVDVAEERHQLRESVAAAHSQHALLVQALQAASDRSRGLEAARSDAQGLAAQVQHQRDTAQAEALELGQKLRLMRETLAERSRDLGEVREDLANKENGLLVLNAALQEATARAQDLASELARLKTEQETRESVMAVLATDMAQRAEGLKRAADALRASEELLVSKNQALLTEQAAHDRTRQELTAAVALMEETDARATTQLTRLTDEATQGARERDHLHQTASALEEQCRGAREELAQLKTTLAERNTELQGARTGLKDRSAAIAQLQEQQASLQGQLDELQTRHADKEAHAQSVETELGVAREESETRRAQLALADAETTSLRVSLESAEHKLGEAANLAAQLDALTRRRDELAHQTQHWQDTVHALEERSQDAARETFLAREQCGRIEDELGRTRARLAEVERLLDEKTEALEQTRARTREVEALTAEEVRNAQARTEDLQQALLQHQNAAQQLEPLRTELQAARGQLERLRSLPARAAELELRVQQEQARAKHAQERVDDETRRSGELVVQVEQLRSETTHLQNMLSALDQDLHTAREMCQAALRDRDTFGREIDRMKAEWTSPDAQTRDTGPQTQAALRERTVEDHRAEAAGAQVELDHIRSALKEAQQETWKKVAELDLVHAVLDESRQLAWTQRAELDHLRAVQEELQTLGSARTAEAEHLRSVLEEAQQLVARRHAELALTMSVLEETHREGRQARAELGWVRSALEEAQGAASHHSADAGHARAALEEAQFSMGGQNMPRRRIYETLARDLGNRDAQVMALRAELKDMSAALATLQASQTPAHALAAPLSDMDALRLRAETADRAWQEAADLRTELERARATLEKLARELDGRPAESQTQAPGSGSSAWKDARAVELEKLVDELREKLERQTREIKDKTERIARLTSRLEEIRP
jgi:chromosome segregation ATPase